METKCDPEFQKELDRISMELDMESTMDEVNEEMVIDDLFDSIKYHSEAYQAGFYDAFWKGRELIINYRIQRSESISQKYQELNRKWGL